MTDGPLKVIFSGAAAADTDNRTIDAGVTVRRKVGLLYPLNYGLGIVFLSNLSQKQLGPTILICISLSSKRYKKGYSVLFKKRNFYLVSLLL